MPTAHHHQEQFGAQYLAQGHFDRNPNERPSIYYYDPLYLLSYSHDKLVLNPPNQFSVSSQLLNCFLVKCLKLGLWLPQV